MKGLTSRIIVCCHKNDIKADFPPYYPVQVGKAISNIDLGITGDDSGQSISGKNTSYCELTGMYWAWKNMKGVDVVGLCHYRRYFDFHSQCRPLFPWTAFKTAEFSNMNLSVPQSILEFVNKGGVVLAKPEVYRYTVFHDYCICHVSDDIRTLHNIIRETQPKEIQDAFFKVVYQGNKLNHFNMFIMPWRLFDSYCSWLFPLLQNIEERIDITHYNPVQKRIYGYMAERLLRVWVDAGNLPVIEKPVIWFNDNPEPMGMYSSSRYLLRLLNNEISHFISKPRQ